MNRQQQQTTRAHPEALIFDLDGTLFRTETVLLPAYERTFERLRQEGLYMAETPPASAILQSLGMLLDHIWLRIIPDASAAARSRANELLLEEQLRLLREGVGELYPGVAATLRRLREAGCRLFVASNGLEHYVKGVVAHMGIASLFDAVYSAGEYATATKTELVRLLLAQFRLSSAWMVGDRSSDVEAGRGNGLYVVGCDYAGFGIESAELAGSDVRIHSFPQLSAIAHADGHLPGDAP